MNLRLRGIVTVDDEVLASRCAKGRVILIDDDPEILLALSALLKFEGLACDCYASATAYLQELAKPQLTFPGPVCLLCDVNMPELTGLDLQRQLQTLQDIPLLLMSGVSGAQEAASAFRAGAVDFLVKPMDANNLLDAVYRALELSSLRQRESAHKTALEQRARTLTEREHEVKLTPFHGHLIVLAEGVRDAQSQTAVPGAISRADGRVGSCRQEACRSGQRVWLSPHQHSGLGTLSR